MERLPQPWADGPNRSPARPFRRLGPRPGAETCRGPDDCPGSDPQRGMVTAELAIGLVALVTMVLGLLWVIAVVTAQVRCIDAARDAARARARGETAAASRLQARHSAPGDARIAFVEHDGLVEVAVTARVRPPWPVLSGVGTVQVHGQAAMALEPGEPAVPAARGIGRVGGGS